MPTQCTIRPARPGDAAAIRDCTAQAFGRYVTAIGRRPAPMDADIAAQIAAKEVHVCTSPRGDILGVIVFCAAPPHMRLESVAVRPDAAGQGIGAALIGVCEDTTRRRGLTAIRLSTNAKMTDNLAIYPRLGYVETGRSLEDGFDRVHFEKALS